MMRKCGSCKTPKDASEFWKGQRRCKDCMREWRRHNRIAVSATKHAIYVANKSAYAIRGRQNHLKRRFGITESQYQAVLSRQFGGCGICRQKPGRKHFAVDHDHASGRVRGILCDRCNRLIGLASDNSIVLSAAAAYVAGNAGREGHMFKDVLYPEALEAPGVRIQISPVEVP
jgi:hypothetical protein